MHWSGTAELKVKNQRLLNIIADLGTVLVAYSGGVDSTLLLRACAEALGPSRVLAVTARSETLAADEEAEARRLAAAMGIEHLVVPISELDDDEFVLNPPERCYLCKRIRYGRLLSLARERGLRWVADGTNADDSRDYRPGLRAASELGIRSPLREAGLTKGDIRELSRAYDLPTWEKPSYACLASRIPYGCPITVEKLRQIDAAETFLRGLGFKQVRVRHHGELARIEVPAEKLASLVADDLAARVTARLKEIGFTYVALDLNGYRTGSLNEPLRRHSQ